MSQPVSRAGSFFFHPLSFPGLLMRSSSQLEKERMAMPLVVPTDSGLYCSVGDFFIDPWKPVDAALITHAHGDHLRPGSKRYLTAEPGKNLVSARIGPEYSVESMSYGESRDLAGVRVSFHPAGHVLGSAQIRLEHRGEVWVISGDYKLQADPTCTGFEPIRCHVFVTESTFGLPIYHWNDPLLTQQEINRWWQDNQNLGRSSIIYSYALGKAQRLLSMVDASIGPIFVHGAVARINQVYRETRIDLPETKLIQEVPRGTGMNGALIIAPPSAQGTGWAKRFEPSKSAFASGWMTIRGARRRRGVDRGFVVSDHADWPGLIEAIRSTGAEKILVTHGYSAILVRWLNEQGLQAQPLQTQYEGEIDDIQVEAQEA